MRAASAIGARARRFTIEMPIDVPDGFGGILRSYQPGPRVWGAMELLSTMERLQAGGLETLVTHRVSLRYRDGMSPDQRLSLGLRHFRIRSADDPNGRREQLVCLVEEIAP